jgi:hypothetical protein
MLITAGYPFPVLGSVVSPGTQTYTHPATPLDFLNNSTTANQSGLTPTLPSSFGSATVSASASASLSGSNINIDTRYGISLNNGTYLQSPSFQSGQASVTLVSLSATFSTSSTLSAILGAILNASGTLGSAPGSFVEVGVKGEIDLDGGAAKGGTSNPFTWYGGYGYDTSGHPFSASSGLTISAPNSSGNFSITGSTTFSGGQHANSTFSTSATLTLVADPGSIIRLGEASSTVSGPPPEIGIIIGGVPEPSSVIELALGSLLVLGVLGWRQPARSSARPKASPAPDVL